MYLNVLVLGEIRKGVERVRRTGFRRRCDESVRAADNAGSTCPIHRRRSGLWAGYVPHTIPLSLIAISRAHRLEQHRLPADNL